MANEYEHLGFSITAEDTSSSVLDGVIAKLEKISKLTDKILNSFNKFKTITIPTGTSGGGISITGGGGAVSIDSERAALEHLNRTLQQQGVVAASVREQIKGLSSEQLAYEQAIRTAANAQATYEQAQNSIVVALNAHEEATIRLAQAKRNLAAIEASNGSASQLKAAQEAVDIARDKLSSAEQRVTNAYLAENKALVNLNSAQTKAAKATDNLTTSAEKSSTSFGKQIISIAAVIKVVKSLTNALVSSLTESGEFIENLNLFAVTFGDTYKETLDWSLDLANNLGFASSEVVRFTGLFKQLATSLEITSDIGDEMSTTLTQLGYDLASFYNIDTESSFEKLQAGIFSGQTKPLRSLGLDVTYQTLDNVLKTEEAFASFGATSKSLDQAAKAQLRLYVVLKNSVNAWGDATKTIESYENQLRVLQGSMSNFKLAIGDVFRDMFSDALVFINGLIQGITAIIRAFVPMQKEVENTSAAMQMYADDTESANEASTSGDLLDFDKFRTLGGGTGGASELASINDVISQQLQEQMAKYEEYMSTLSTKANEVAESLKNWFVTTDENGENTLTMQAKGLLAVLVAIPTALTAISAHNWYSKMSTEIASLIEHNKALTLSQKAFQAVFSKTGLIVSAVVGIFALMYIQNEEFRDSVNRLVTALLSLLGTVLTPIIDILNNFVIPVLSGLLDTLSAILTPIINGISWLAEFGNGWLVFGTLIATVVIAVLIKLISWLRSTHMNALEALEALSDGLESAKSGISKFGDFLQKAEVRLAMFTTGVIMAASAILDLSMNWNSMTDLERTRGILLGIAGAAFVLASAFANVKAVALGFTVVGMLAGIAGVIAGIVASSQQAKELDSSIQQMATGGITDANLIMTNEYGKREWVGQMKNKTAVVNDTQMSTVMENSVARGVVRAMSVNNMTQEPITVTVNAVLDGETVYRNQQRVSAKHGKGYATKR